MEAPSAQVVGNAFVEQYYQVLHRSPEMVHKFYQDISLLSRPDVGGSMTTVTTMQAINEKILSLKHEDYTADIRTADAQESYGRGVIVLVTGFLIGKDNVQKKFTQSFFLAPQDNGYFVLNDVFRFVEENGSSQNPDSAYGTEENTQGADLKPDAGPVHASESVAVEHETHSEVEDQNDTAEVCDPSDNEGSVVEDEAVEHPGQSTQIEVIQHVVSQIEPQPVAQEDAPKKSYASILKVTKSKAVPTPVPTGTVKAEKVATDKQQTVNSEKPSPVLEASASTGDSAPETNDVAEEAEGHSIHVRNLPHNATVSQLEEAFKNFGPIKRNGIQVRSNKLGLTYGFVEFEASTSMHSALEASAITIGDHQAFIEEKRTTTKVGAPGRGRGRGGFRGDNFRGRVNFGGGRGYGRNEFRNQNEFSGRSRGSTGRGGETYQRVNQNGSGRGGRQGGANKSSVAS